MIDIQRDRKSERQIVKKKFQVGKTVKMIDSQTARHIERQTCRKIVKGRESER